MATVFLNGSFITQDDARISAFDAGLQHGVGLFETMMGEHSQGRARVFRVEEHLSRLAQSARELGLSDQIQVGALAEAVLDTLKRSGLPSLASASPSPVAISTPSAVPRTAPGRSVP